MGSARSSRRQSPLISAFLVLAFAAAPSNADSPACNQARAIVDEVKSWSSGANANHVMALARLATARDLCPALGDAWKYSYCSAKALGDTNRARIYKDRAIFNGVMEVECSGGTAPGPLPSRVRAKYALLVGVGTFSDKTIQPLKYPAKDARDLREVLVHPVYGHFPLENVFLLTDEQATRANILKAVNEIAERAREDDLVLLFISSHGSPSKSGLGLRGIGYIVAHDSTQSEIYVNSIDFEDLSKKVSLIGARRKVLLLDTCFSGQGGSKSLLLEGRGIEPQTAAMFLSGEGSYVITSSQEDEASFESDALQNGYFTHFLIEALKEGSEPPTVGEVFSRLSTRVREAVATDKGASQKPQLYPRDGTGDVRIGVVPTP